MRRWVGLAGCAALASCATLPAPSPQSTSPILLAVVTWNMDAGRGDLSGLVGALASGRLTMGQTPGEFALLLQESREANVRAVAVRGGAAVFFAPAGAPGTSSLGNAIVSTRPVTGGRRVELPAVRQQRNAVVAEVEVAGEPLFLVSAHLENRISWWRGGLFSDGGRARQAEALLQSLPASGPGIVGGDMNTWLGRQERAWRLFLRRFTDTPDDPAAPTFGDRLVLDHLFFDLPPGWIASRWVLPDRYGSDHHPVIGTVRPSYSP